jgi:hypothetical protein
VGEGAKKEKKDRVIGSSGDRVIGKLAARSVAAEPPASGAEKDPAEAKPLSGVERSDRK